MAAEGQVAMTACPYLNRGVITQVKVRFIDCSKLLIPLADEILTRDRGRTFLES
jgi:hypothetical protein